MGRNPWTCTFAMRLVTIRWWAIEARREICESRRKLVGGGGEGRGFGSRDRLHVLMTEILT
jgi:hypothetical protein